MKSNLYWKIKYPYTLQALEINPMMEQLWAQLWQRAVSLQVDHPQYQHYSHKHSF